MKKYLIISLVVILIMSVLIYFITKKVIEDGSENMFNIPEKSFSVDKNEVTVKEFKMFVKESYKSEKYFKKHNSNHEFYKDCNYDKNDFSPMNCVSWEGANKYCESLNKRLPTKKELEYISKKYNISTDISQWTSTLFEKKSYIITGKNSKDDEPDYDYILNKRVDVGFRCVKGLGIKEENNIQNINNSNKTNEPPKQIQTDKKIIIIPYESVKLPNKNYSIDNTEVTVEQYLKCIESGKCEKPREEGCTDISKRYCNFNMNKLKHPINNISFNEAKKYCESQGMRLPTKKEWIYAAKGGEIYTYSGSNILSDVGWYLYNYQEENKNDTTHIVGTKKANKYGLYDMSGNVFEWTDIDKYDKKDGNGYICGGSFFSKENECSTSYCIPFPKNEINLIIGFRCVKDNDVKGK